MKLYKTKEVADVIEVNRKTITDLCKRKKLNKTKNIYQFPLDVWHSVLQKKYLKKLNKLENNFLPEIIYVHTTWIILESKINHK